MRNFFKEINEHNIIHRIRHVTKNIYSISNYILYTYI